jgi:hypothetical protein
VGILNSATLLGKLTAAVVILSFSYTVIITDILCLTSVEMSISSCNPHSLAMRGRIVASQLSTTICGRLCSGRSAIVQVTTLNFGGPPLFFISPVHTPISRFGSTAMKVLKGSRRVFRSVVYVAMIGTPFPIQNLGDASAKPIFNCQFVTIFQSIRMGI